MTGSAASSEAARGRRAIAVRAKISCRFGAARRDGPCDAVRADRSDRRPRLASHRIHGEYPDERHVERYG